MLNVISSAETDAWSREGINTELGAISFESQVILIAGHDGYHTTQIAQYLEQFQ